MLHNKRFFFAAFFLVAGISINLSANAHADTSASVDDSVTVTVHVLADDVSGGDANVDFIEDDVSPDAYVDDETVDNSDDEAEDLGLEEDTEEEINSGEEDGVDIDEEDEYEDDPNLAATTGSDPKAPETGVATSVDELDAGSDPINLPIILSLVIGILLIALIIKAIKDERSQYVRRQLYRRPSLLPNSRFGLHFKNDVHKYQIGKITRLIAISCLVIFVGVFFLTNRTTEEVDAASDAYPYNISLDSPGHYDIYVKQGEFVRSAFKVTTTTNNPTGYTLAMATDQPELISDNEATLEAVAADTTATNFADNTWGFSTNGSSKYSRVPNTRSAGATLHKANASTPQGNYTVVYFGVKAATDLPVGDYTTTIRLMATTNPVEKTLKLLNGNVATVTRVSDGTTLKNNATIYVGEQLKINNTADVSGITQTASVNGNTVANGDVINVTKNVKVSTSDDSMHFLKNVLSSKGGGSNGDAILVKSQGKYWLVDTGHNQSDSQWLNGSKVAAYLKELGVTRLDYVLLTHAHGDHTGGLKKLISKRYIRPSTTVYLRGCDAVQDIDNSYEDYGKAYPGLKNSCNTKVNLLKNIQVTQSDGTTTTQSANVIDFYNHEAERANIYKNGIDFGNFHVDFYNIEKGSNGHIAYDRYRENLNSIGTKWTHKPSGKTVFLSGDFEYGNEATYGSKIGKIDILKAGHHGAKTSNTYDFYKKLNPSTVIVTSVNVMSVSTGAPGRQAAAWAYVEQKGGAVYFTGDSSGSAVAINFTKSGYSIKKGVKHSITADANTGNKKDTTNYHRKIGSHYWNWNGGVLGWARPYSTVGKGGVKVYYNMTSANDTMHRYVGNYVYVYQSQTSGNLISQKDLCVNNYKYTFKSAYGDGVSKGRTKVKSC